MGQSVSENPRFEDKASDLLFRGLMRAALALPYERRVPFMGAVMTRVLGPLMGYPKRIRENLLLVCPELSDADIKAISRGAINNLGRFFAEVYSGKEFTERMANLGVSGPGLEVLDQAHQAGKPAILMTAHLGNYEAPRSALIARGYRIAGVYRPMRNKLFNHHYTRAMADIGPAYTNDRVGLRSLVKHIRGGGMAEFLIDQHSGQADTLKFFSFPAKTYTTAAELSLKYDAPMVCMYGIRRPNGLDFDIVVEAPIPPSDPKTMTQAVNDSIEARVRENMGQWSWSHRRWKVLQQNPGLMKTI